MSKVERTCGTDVVVQMEMSTDMMSPLMRERCPGNAHNSLGCKVFLHTILLFIVLWVVFLIWSLIATFNWLRVRKQLFAIKTAKSNAKLSPDSVKVELQPLTNEPGK